MNMVSAVNANLVNGANNQAQQTQTKAQQTGLDGVLPFGLFMGEPAPQTTKPNQETQDQTNGINSFESALYSIMNNMITQSVQNTQNGALNNF